MRSEILFPPTVALPDPSIVSRAGDDCGGWLCVRSDDGTTTSLPHRPGKEGLLEFREEQEEVSPSPPA